MHRRSCQGHGACQGHGRQAPTRRPCALCQGHGRPRCQAPTRRRCALDVGYKALAYVWHRRRLCRADGARHRCVAPQAIVPSRWCQAPTRPRCAMDVALKGTCRMASEIARFLACFSAGVGSRSFRDVRRFGTRASRRGSPRMSSPMLQARRGRQSPRSNEADRSPRCRALALAQALGATVEELFAAQDLRR